MVLLAVAVELTIILLSELSKKQLMGGSLDPLEQDELIQVDGHHQRFGYATFKVTADTYTQAVTPVKRDAQAKIAKLIMADGSEPKAITPTLQ